MEALKNVHAVVMDKTGTVTKGNFVVQKVMPAPGVDETEVCSFALMWKQYPPIPLP